MAKNYYLILGVTADASREDIKAAFRRRALELHPDRSGLESGPFQEVQEAYSVLGDPERRHRYDRQYHRRAARRARSGPTPEPLVAARPAAEPFRPVEPARGFREVSLADALATYHPSPGTPDGWALRIPLARFGIRNFFLTVWFRVSRSWD